MGFETSLFTAPVDENLLCSLCYGVFDRPSLACLNGHVFCAECLAQTKRRRDACPDCRDPIFDTAPLVRPTQNTILGLTLRCENSRPKGSEGGGDASADGDDEAKEPPATRRRTTRSGAAVRGEERKEKEEVCDWTGTVADYRTHVESCDFRIVRCPNKCRAEVAHRLLEHHKKNECTRRQVTCPACSQSVKFSLLHVHKQDYCPEKDVKCRHCKADMKRKDRSGHRKICPELPLSCEFDELGCCDMIPRNKMAAHHADKARYHAKLLSDRICYNKDWEATEIQWEVAKHHIQGNVRTAVISPPVPIFGNNFQLTLHLDGPKVEIELSARASISSRRSAITVRKIDINVEVKNGEDKWFTAHPIELNWKMVDRVPISIAFRIPAVSFEMVDLDLLWNMRRMLTARTKRPMMAKPIVRGRKKLQGKCCWTVLVMTSTLLSKSLLKSSGLAVYSSLHRK